jgi:ribosomal RNA methyltransferase Nop2
MAEVNLRIQGIIDILSDFKTKKEEDKTRNDTMSELKKLLMIYYDYNEDIMSLIMYLFPPNEAVEFLESNNTQRVMTIRTNSIKTKRRELAKSLIQRGVNLDPLAEWTKVGLKVYDSQIWTLWLSGPKSDLRSTTRRCRWEPLRSTWLGTTCFRPAPPSCP